MLKHRLADAVRIAFPEWSRPFLLYLDSAQSQQSFAMHQQTNNECKPEESGESVWEPSYIADERTSRGRKQFLVKWVGSNRTSWIDADQLREDGCTDVIAEWEEFRAQAHWLAPAVANPSMVTPLHSSARLALDRPLRRPVTLEHDGMVYEISEHPIATTPWSSRKRGDRLACGGTSSPSSHNGEHKRTARITIVA